MSEFGELNWQNPTVKGEYATAMKITEYRGGQAIGYTTVDMQLNVMERSLQPRVSLLNKERLTVNDDGSIWARPNQPLKLEFYVENPANGSVPVNAAQFSDLDTLDLASPALTARDTANGLAVTLTLMPGTALVREEAYILGLRGGILTQIAADLSPAYRYGWGFAYVVVQEQQPTAAEDELRAAGFALYPNLVVDSFILEAPALPDLCLRLYNMSGQEVISLKLTAAKNSIKRPEALAAGLYTYRITSNKDIIRRGKLLLR